jgi:hypothetical protein
MPVVFQYGSNTDANRLNSVDRLCGAAIPLGAAWTVDVHQLHFDLWSGGSNCAAADLLPGSGRRIFGVLFDIPADRIFRDQSNGDKTLDQIEGSRYQHTTFQIRRLGAETDETVLTYIGVPDQRQDNIRTSEAYVTHILRGLKQADAPPEYLSYVIDRINANNPDLSPFTHDWFISAQS